MFTEDASRSILNCNRLSAEAKEENRVGRRIDPCAHGSMASILIEDSFQTLLSFLSTLLRLAFLLRLIPVAVLFSVAVFFLSHSLIQTRSERPQPCLTAQRTNTERPA